MKKLIFLIQIIYSTVIPVKAQWIKQFSPDHDLRDIEFINKYTGWSCGANNIYKTTNGGITWNEQSHPDAYLIQQIFPVNENVVYACGYWNFMKTTDGGENWFSLFNGIPNEQLPVLEGLHFINENTGWLVGDVVAMKTTNGGKSFIDSARIEEIAQDVYFKDSLNGIMCGYSGGFRKTTDGGITWNRIQVLKPGWLYDFYRIAVFNDSIVWVGSRPVYRSTDFGNTWDSISYYPFPEQNDYVYNIKFSSALTGYACGASLPLYKTTDGGYSWFQQQTSQFVPGLNLGLFAYNDFIVWSCGRRIIMNTLTGGQVGIDNNNVVLNKGFELFQNYPNPFNPETKITYKLQKAVNIRIVITNALGKQLKTLVNQRQNEGNYSISFNGNAYPSGIYYYSLFTDNDIVDTKKMLLTK